jgi:ribosome-associated toxin RatA of RatAB toxin-antitoxin module
MGAVSAEHSELIGAGPQACFDAITDFETYPQWQSAVRECRVLSRDGKLGTVVETVIDAKVKKVRYVLRYRSEPPHRLWWDYVEGDVKSIAGGYDFEDAGDGATRATYRVAIDPGRMVPGPVRRLLAGPVMRTSVRELRERVESLS